MPDDEATMTRDAWCAAARDLLTDIAALNPADYPYVDGESVPYLIRQAQRLITKEPTP